MLRIAVADDEFYARKGLIRKIHIAEADAVIKADFESGRQMLDYLRAHKGEIDLLFTDVKMPQMDGLELSRAVMEEELGVEVIIVSGYNEFEYAKKAMVFGVNNYLVKPVQIEELQESLEKIKKKIRKNEEKVQAQMTQSTLEYLSIPELAGHEDWKKRFLLPVFQKYQGKTGYLAIIQREFTDRRNPEIDREIAAFAEKNNGCWFYFRRYYEYALLLFQDEEDQSSLASKLDHFLKRSSTVLDEKMTVGLSQNYQNADDLKKAYQEAVYAINQRLIDGWVKVYSYKEELKPQNHFSKEAEVVLEDAIKRQKCDAAIEIVSKSLEKCRDSYSLYITISGIFNLMYRLYCRSSRSEEKDSEHAYMLFSYKSDLYGFRHFCEVKKYVSKIVESMCREQEDKRHHYIISEILDYIEKNYQTNINLSELAEHKFFMNSSYLSRLFKNEVGQTFSKYLMEFRIRKAAAFLENDLMKINDAAMLAGYNDVSHFIQYFKKFYGCTPEEYRSRKMEENKNV